MADKKRKLTPFQQEQIDTAQKILEYKLASEANVVSILYQLPDLLYDISLNLDDFSNNVWKVYFAIINELVLTERKNVIDDVTVGLYLEKHPKLRLKYQEYGGWGTIQSSAEYVSIENFYGYLTELKKWKAVLQLCKKGFPVKDKLPEYADMTLEEIYDDFEIHLNNIFVNTNEDVQSYNVFDNMIDFVENLGEESQANFPFYDFDRLTEMTGGFNLNGNIYGLGAGSGCVDCDTEFFNGKTWKKIADYDKTDMVLQYNKDGTAELVYPLNYIRQKADYLWHFKTKYGIDQCLSDDHTVVYKTSMSGNRTEGRLATKKFSELRRLHEKATYGFKGKFYTSFNYFGEGIKLNDFWIRIMIAVFADGSYQKDKVTNPNSSIYKQVRFHLKKERKKERLEYLLKKANVEYRKVDSASKGYSDYYFITPFISKNFPDEWYNCNHRQMEIIADEVMLWDGCVKSKNTYTTTNKKDADFIQFVYSSLNYRASIVICNRIGQSYSVNGKEYIRKSIEYCVNYTSQNMVGISSNNKVPITKYKTVDGYEYCFTVPSHMLVLRRNNKIFITGNCGKSTLAFNFIIPTAIKTGQRTVFFINEEDEKKFKKELLVWTANNVFIGRKPKYLKYDPLYKYELRDGNFSQETKELLVDCAKWIEEQKDKRILTVIPLERYSAKIVIKLIKKYATAHDIRLFVLDTLKESFDAETNEIYKSMMRDMIALYDVVKPSAKNVGLLVTYQLGKSSLKMRHLTNNEIGQAKSILDVMSVNIMMRRPYDDEYEEGSKHLDCYYIPKGASKATKIQYKLKKDNHPMILFITKNRFGETDTKQIIAECDLGTNICKDVAYTNVPQDW